MYIVVVGAGRLGYYLTRDLLESGHEVTLVDWDFNRVQLLSSELGDVMLYASGSSIEGLEKAGCNRADLIVAATGDDEDNLVVCQLGKKYFKVPKAVARINNPKNEEVFRVLGVGTTVSGTKAIAGIIENYVFRNCCSKLSEYMNGEYELNEIEITENSKCKGKVLGNLQLPQNTSIQILIRGSLPLKPDPDLTIEIGDKLIVYTASSDKDVVYGTLRGMEE